MRQRQLRRLSRKPRRQPLDQQQSRLLRGQACRTSAGKCTCRSEGPSTVRTGGGACRKAYSPRCTSRATSGSAVRCTACSGTVRSGRATFRRATGGRCACATCGSCGTTGGFRPCATANGQSWALAGDDARWSAARSADSTRTAQWHRQARRAEPAFRAAPRGRSHRHASRPAHARATRNAAAAPREVAGEGGAGETALHPQTAAAPSSCGRQEGDGRRAQAAPHAPASRRRRPQRRRRRYRAAGTRPPRDVTITEGITIRELAEKLDVRAKDLLKTLLDRGVFASINQALDVPTATTLAEAFSGVVNVVSLKKRWCSKSPRKRPRKA